jgi:hypothetical protein
MKDMLGRELRVGDYALNFWGYQGGFRKAFFYVTGFTLQMVRIHFFLEECKCKPDKLLILNDIPIEHRQCDIPKNITPNTDQLPIIYGEKDETGKSDRSGWNWKLSCSPS